MDATVIGFAIVALGVFAYVVFDGFGLGVGIVFALFPDAEDRDAMMRTLQHGDGAARGREGRARFAIRVAVLLAVLLALLFAALRTGHAAALEPLTLPLMSMLACLIVRGAAFEIRARNRESRTLGDLAFIGGSAGAALFQGVALGLFAAGQPVAGGPSAGAVPGWLAPAPLWSGLGLVATYALLGTCWLVARTGGGLQRRLHRLVWPLTMALLLFVVLVSVWTPLRDAALASRWFDARLFLNLAPVPLLVLVCAYWMHRAVRASRHDTPYRAALGLVALGYLGLLVDLWP